MPIQIPTPGSTPAQAPVEFDPYAVRDLSNNARHVTVDDYAPKRTGLLSTLTKKGGGPVMGDPGPDHLIMLGGVQVSLRQAEGLGAVYRDASGRYIEGQAPGVSRHDAAPEPTPVDGPARLAPELEPDFDRVVRDADTHLGDGAMLSIVSRALANPGDGTVQRDLLQLAHASGQSFSTMMATIDRMTEALHEKALDAARSVGVTDDAGFETWLDTQDRHAVNRATLSQYRGDLGPLKALAARFVREVPDTRPADGGHPYVNIDPGTGRTIPVSAAVARRLGLNVD